MRSSLMSKSRALVFVVDDDEDIRSALSDVLGVEGYSVETAINGLDALGKLQRGLMPDVMLLDLMMPVMSGLELLDYLHRQRPEDELPVIVVSANRGYDAEDLGVSAVVRKPCEVEQLLRSIEQVVA
jgi:CheY-like chemotaxis protein